MVLALAIELYLHLHIVQKPESVTCTAVMLKGTPVLSYRKFLFAAGPIPTIQELEAQEARDADADSIFEEADAPAAGVMQQSNSYYTPADHLPQTKAVLSKGPCAAMLQTIAAQTVYGCIWHMILCWTQLFLYFLLQYR